MARFTLVARLIARWKCSFHLNSRSNTTPRSFAVADGWMIVPCMTIYPLLCSPFFLARWISSVSTAKHDPVRLAHVSIGGSLLGFSGCCLLPTDRHASGNSRRYRLMLCHCSQPADLPDLN